MAGATQVFAGPLSNAATGAGWIVGAAAFIGRGHLIATADLCIFDPKAHWILSADKFVSRGRNTPFLGWEFTGRVTHTLVGGEVVFEPGDV
jgi:dihydroorotase-like cyclic amidohydrolase